MHADIINIALAFLEGVALIISPCILPILPIILSGSLTGNKARPFGIITGFVLAFTLVTLFSRFFIEVAHLKQDAIRNVSFIILFLLGLMMLSTTLTDKFNLVTQRLTRVGSSLESANNPQSGFFGGMLFGGLVGIIWTPCAGPILAVVIVQVVLQQTTLSSLLVVLAFSIGAVLPMLLIAIIGRQVVNQFPFIRNNTTLLRKVLGAIIMSSVVYLFYSSSVSLSYAQSDRNASVLTATSLINGLEYSYKAPEIEGITDWINSPPLHIAELKGKVVLIDFWTYSCINCLRTLPYIKEWYANYHDKGLEIIGVHSPEFEFEHVLSNVSAAVKKLDIHYPVALDNHFVTWRNYQNQYWPAHFLIDKEGDVVYQHFGEGEYDVTENNIRYLLGLSKGVSAKIKAEENYSLTQTPETYLGYGRMEKFSSPGEIIKNHSSIYRFPPILSQDQWALQGQWTIMADKIMAESASAAIRLHFKAGKVFAVMGTQGHAIQIKLLLNGKPINTVTVNNHQLYTLVDLDHEIEGILELSTSAPGLEVYTFTFGG